MVAQGAGDVEEVWDSVGFGVSEYTLVFRSSLSGTSERAGTTWAVVRPAQYASSDEPRQPAPKRTSVAHMFAVPICSALALEGVAYERFLNRSGILDEALQLLADVSLDDPHSVETARRRIHSLVMAAEVMHIVDGLTA